MLNNHRRYCWGENKSIMKKFKTVICPEGCRNQDLIPGKEYEVFNVSDELHGFVSFELIDEIGFKMFCLSERCEWIDGGNWIIKEEV